ncbi:MAG: C4-dicarboxylate ABC transporter substrate-binding protein [Dethiosulfovibrio peptidovorans]|nr:MAG: C4-dicarboxylate ABC transporter substrate-binding protein [Dethiosulfovibrio peptidovorans]
MLKKWFVVFAVFMAVSFSVALCPVEASFNKRLKFGVAVSKNSTWYQGAKKFAELINERTEGRFVVDIFPSDQLAAGNIIKGLELLRMGVTDIDMRSTIIYTTVDPKFTVPLMPWILPSYEKADEAMGGKGGEMLFNLVRKNGIEPLAFGESGFRQITNNKHPIVAPEDLAGLKIRVPTIKMYIALFKALKADPTSINFGELFAALQQGTVDGQENPPDVIVSARIQEVQRYMTLWNASYDPIIMSASNKFWKSLSSEEQGVFLNAAQEAMAYQRALAREKNKELIKTFAEKMEITTLTPEQINAFQKKAAPVYEEYKKIIGTELLEAFGYSE